MDLRTLQSNTLTLQMGELRPGEAGVLALPDSKEVTSRRLCPHAARATATEPRQKGATGRGQGSGTGSSWSRRQLPTRGAPAFRQGPPVPSTLQVSSLAKGHGGHQALHGVPYLTLPPPPLRQL